MTLYVETREKNMIIRNDLLQLGEIFLAQQLQFAEEVELLLRRR